MKTHNRAELISNLLDTSLTEVGISTILEQFDAPSDNRQLSTEWKDYVDAMRIQIINSNVALKTAYVMLTGNEPSENIIDLPQAVISLAVTKIEKSAKHSTATTNSNKDRAIPLSTTAKAALLAAFVELRQKSTKEPGWKRVSDRAKQILGRDLKLKGEAKLLTKARVSPWIKMFNTLEEQGLMISSEIIFEIYDLPKQQR